MLSAFPNIVSASTEAIFFFPILTRWKAAEDQGEWV
jgi:hypothetical protein